MGNRKGSVAGKPPTVPKWLTGQDATEIANRCGIEKYDSDHLAADLNRAIVEFRLRALLRSDAEVARHTALAERVDRQASRLVKELGGDALTLEWITAGWQLASPSPLLSGADLQNFNIGGPSGNSFPPTKHAIVIALEGLARSAAEQKNRLRALQKAGKFHCSAAEWLAGHDLPEVYERHSKRPPSISRPTSKVEPDSAFIRFVLATFDLAVIYKNKKGEPYSAEFVVRAPAAARRGRRQPKPL